MANKRIKDLTEKSSFVSGDYFPIDNANGTKKVNASKIMTPLSNVQGEVSGSSDAYKTTKAYKVGDCVIYNNTLYQCTTACSAGSWSANQNCFTATTLATAVTQLNNDLTPLKNKLNGAYVVKYRSISSVRPSATGSASLGSNILNEKVIAVLPTADSQYLAGIYFMGADGTNYCKVVNSADLSVYTGLCNIRVYYIDD